MAKTVRDLLKEAGWDWGARDRYTPQFFDTTVKEPKGGYDLLVDFLRGCRLQGLDEVLRIFGASPQYLTASV